MYENTWRQSFSCYRNITQFQSSSQTPTEKINNLISRFESVIHKMNTQQTPMSRVRVRGISYADKNLISRVCGPLKYLLHIKSVSKTQRG